MIAPIAVALIVAGSLAGTGVVVHPQNPVLGNALIGAGVGTAIGGGVGTVAGVGFGVTTGAVAGGAIGGVGGVVASQYPRRVVYNASYKNRFVSYGSQDRFSIASQS